MIDIPLGELSYYRTGGTCEGVIVPRNTEEVRNAVDWLRTEKKPYFILGGGTNSLVSDDHFPGYVISFHEMTALRSDGVVKGSAVNAGDVNGGDRNESEDVKEPVDEPTESIRIFAAAGVENTDISEFAAENGLWDLSWMNRLPGQIGGTARMNARCYGGEISQFVSKIRTVTQKGLIKTYEFEPGSDKARKLFRGYKDTDFMDSGEIVCEVGLTLQRFVSKEKNSEKMRSVREKMEFCKTDRMSKYQFVHPSCGCVFKNDHSPEVSVSSGFLLEKAGLKGSKVGSAEVSEGHANFVFNLHGEATSRDILELSFEMRERVFEKFGVWLEYEMEVLGEFEDDLDAALSKTRPLDTRDEKKRALDEARREFQNRS